MFPGVSGRPPIRKIRLEAMSLCQLRCPTCPTTTGEARPVIGQGYLKTKDFARLLQKNPKIQEVELSNFGEILLNPELPQILELAHTHKVRLSADNGLNLNTATDELLECLVRFGLKSATISIDGASPETYSRYRIRGDFDQVLANVATLNRYKAEYRTDHPKLVWQFVVFGHNEQELPAARRMASELNMEFRPKLSYESDFSPPRDLSFVRSQLAEGAVSRAEFEERTGKHYARPICHQLWTEPQINWDGKILGCCINYWAEFGGNAFEDGLEAALQGERMMRARDMLQGKKDARDDIPCSKCSVYKSMRCSGHWLSMPEIYWGRSRWVELAHRLKRVLRPRSGPRIDPNPTNP